MKVRVVLSVDVDVQAWRDEYGRPDATVAEIREDVKASFTSAASNEGGIYPPGVIRDVAGEPER